MSYFTNNFRLWKNEEIEAFLAEITKAKGELHHIACGKQGLFVLKSRDGYLTDNKRSPFTSDKEEAKKFSIFCLEDDAYQDACMYWDEVLQVEGI